MTSTRALRQRLFPLETWRRLVSTQLRRSRLDDLTYVGRGHRRLREEVARHLGAPGRLCARARTSS